MGGIVFLGGAGVLVRMVTAGGLGGAVLAAEAGAEAGAGAGAGVEAGAGDGVVVVFPAVDVV